MIYIIRHGQTLWNVQNRKQGQKDSPLTNRGLLQAKAITQILKKETNIKNFTWVHSPLYRAWQSCYLVTESLKIEPQNIINDNLLREHSFGEWEGLNETEIELKYPGMIRKRESQWWSYKVPGGESYQILYARIGQFLKKYPNNKDYIFYTHEMVSKMLRSHLLKLSQSESLKLNHPQDVIYQISNEKIIEITTPPI